MRSGDASGYGSDFAGAQALGAAAPRGSRVLTVTWTLWVLFLANLLNAADRALLGVVAEPVGQDLGLTDVQLSLLNGLLFVVFNLFAGVLIAQRVDRGNRKKILGAGVLVWSLATAATALAQDFATLALCRIMVGVGEATVFPVALSMIGDLFKPSSRPRSVAIYQVGGVLGFVTGSVLAGVLAAAYGWRAMFLACGLAGLAVVAIVMLTMSEPTRTLAERPAPSAAGPGLFRVIGSIFRIPGFAWLIAAYGVASVPIAIVSAWGATFLQRVHEVELAQVGAVIGPAVALGGVGGLLVSGVCAGWFIRRRGEDRAALLVPLIALPLATVVETIFLHSPTLGQAMTAAAAMNLLMSCATPPCVATALGATPAQARGLTSTLLLISHGLIGGALGPLLVGVFSDLLGARFGADALRHAMGVMIFAPLVAGLFLFQAYRSLGRGPSMAAAARA
jgi:MFS family permease